MKNDKVLLGHGSGGKLSHELISTLFIKYFDNEILRAQTDSALVPVSGNYITYTTDSFVVDPVFFPGGDIGKLAVCGTVNDLAVSGANPRYLSAAFIIEEGFPFEDLERIVISMAAEARKANVQIVTGDTKVVNRGHCDKIFINTSGVGLLNDEYQHISSGRNIKSGDKIIINGYLGDHGMAVLGARNELNIQADITSDCASLNHLIAKVLEVCPNVRFMRDATRGGLATVLAELAKNQAYGIMLEEENIPVRESVRGFCELLGFDPLYVANEGKVVFIVPGEDAENILQVLRSDRLGTESEIIGEIVPENSGRCWLSTSVGGRRIIDMIAGEQLPRIC